VFFHGRMSGPWISGEGFLQHLIVEIERGWFSIWPLCPPQQDCEARISIVGSQLEALPVKRNFLDGPQPMPAAHSKPHSPG